MMCSRSKEISYELHPLGEKAVLIQLGDEINPETYKLVQAVSRQLENISMPGMLEQVPAYCSVAVYYDPIRFQQNRALSAFDHVCQKIRQLIDQIKIADFETKEVVEIPVCYGGEFGPDLAVVAEYNGLTTTEVINIHSTGDYFVYMIGFTPGFPYIGGMSKKISAPRRSSPRVNIPAGSIGIAGNQTGIYPIETPGGWQIIGRTPLELFRPNEDIPSYLKTGDHIRFVPITPKEFQMLKGGET